MYIKVAEEKWIYAWEAEKTQGELAFLSKAQIEQLQYIDENGCGASECWEHVAKARQELASLEDMLQRRRGNPAQIRAKTRAAANQVRLTEKRLQYALQRMDLDDIAWDLAREYHQDYKLRLMERLAELPSTEK